MNDTATVRIFLTKGNPTSVRTAEISNWTGKAIAGPRSQLEGGKGAESPLTYPMGRSRLSRECERYLSG